jgi:GAF domain-containing protein
MRFDEVGALVFSLARDAHGEPLGPEQFEMSRSLVQQVAHTGTPVVTTDARQDPRLSGHDSAVQFGLRSILAVPLKVRGQISGVLYVDNKARNALFTQSELELLSAFAGQAAVAIENARLYTQTDQALAARVADLQTIHTIDRQLNAAAQNLDSVLNVTLDLAVHAVLAERGWMGLVADGSIAGVRVVAGRAGGVDMPADHPRLRQVLSSGETQRFAPGDPDPAAIVVPVMRDRHVVAIIVVERAGPPFSAVAAESLAGLAAHAALAIENARLYAALKDANDA